MTNGHIGFADYLLHQLEPLTRGQTVKLVVEVRRRHGRKEREVKIGMLLAPGPLYGFVEQAVVVSLLGSGSCVIFPKQGKGVSALTRAGLPIKLARVLMEKLKSLYGE